MCCSCAHIYEFVIGIVSLSGPRMGLVGSLKRGSGVACMSSVNLGVKSSTDQESQKLFMYTAPTNAETFVF